MSSILVTFCVHYSSNSIKVEFYIKNSMRRLTLFFSLLVTIALNAQELTVAQHLEDFDLVVWQVENNYCGFSTKVNSENLSTYVDFKKKLRNQVESGTKKGRDAAGEYTAFFGDYHLFVIANGFNCTQEFMPEHRQIPHYWDSMEYEPTKAACKVTDRTFLIRVPSFSGQDPDYRWIIESIESYQQSGCDNLIIDIRGNSGGQDGYYKPFLELLYDHPGVTDNIEFYNTEENRESYIQLAEGMGNPDWMIQGIQRLEESENNSFVIFDEETISIEYDSICHRPIKAAIIIDGLVASSGEQMLIELKATSQRTTFYGRDNTRGCIDFSNVRPAAELPNCKATLAIPTTRSLRVAKGTGIDDTGIEPDVKITLPLPTRLTDNVDEWAIWVAEELEK